MTSYVPRTYYRTRRGLSVAVLVSESKIAGRWGPEMAMHRSIFLALRNGNPIGSHWKSQ